MRSLPQLLLRWAAHCEVADLKYTLQGPVDAEMETMKIVRQSADENDASSAQIENDAEKAPTELEITWSCGICEISCLTQRTRKYEFELWTNAAQILAEQHLRRKPTLPSDDVNVDFLAVSCGLAGLTNSLRNFVMNSTNFGLLKPVMPNHCASCLSSKVFFMSSTSLLFHFPAAQSALL